jgi:ribokinase
MVGMLGTDSFAADYRTQMIAEGCNIDGIGEVPGNYSSGVACISVDSAGHNTIVVVPGANAALSVEDVDRNQDIFQRAAVLLCQNEINIDVTIRALDLARAAGCITVFNPAPASSACASAASHCHVLCPNEVELATLSGLPVDSEGQVQAATFKLLDENPDLRAVVVTLGDRGVCVVQRTGTDGAHSVAFIAAPRVDVVDTVGAGDCFIGKLTQYCRYTLRLV